MTKVYVVTKFGDAKTLSEYRNEIDARRRVIELEQHFRRLGYVTKAVLDGYEVLGSCGELRGTLKVEVG